MSSNAAKARGVRAMLKCAATLLALVTTQAQAPADKMADPDARANALLATLSDAEKQRLIVSAFWTQSAGVTLGLPDKGVPAMGETDSTVGVFRWLTPIPYVSLPSGTAMAASWNPTAISDAYAMVAREARTAGLSVLLAPGLNLVRELRNGRVYEYFGEDPLLSGTLGAAAVTGVQRENVIATVKHFALNDQESMRHSANSILGESAMRESDLLAFQLALKADPGAVMCSYNLVNGVYACMNKYLLTDVLKNEWGFKGWVMTDWGATTDAILSANAGLDQYSAGTTEQGGVNPMMRSEPSFGAPLDKAIAAGLVPASRRDDMARRVLRTAFAKGVVDNPPVKSDLAVDADIAVSRRTAAQGIVLLKNDGILPLAEKARSIAIIGNRADAAVITKITTVPGEPRSPFGAPPPAPKPGEPPAPPPMMKRPSLWALSSPMKALQALRPNTAIRFNDGTDPAAAAALAKGSDITILFALQDTNEGEDLQTLRLSDDQEKLIDAVAAANRNLIVVLENGTAVTMPWANKARGIVVAWFPGSGGGEAIADILTGRVNPSGKLPISFPLSERQQPRVDIPGQPVAGSADNPVTTMRAGPEKTVDVDYRIEGADVGYKWFERQKAQLAYPFGFGLSYTTFGYAAPKAEVNGDGLNVRLTVRNTGKQRGQEVAQVYLDRPFRLIGFAKVDLEPGEARQVRIAVDPKLIANWDAQNKVWRQLGGSHQLLIGASSRDIRLRAPVILPAHTGLFLQ